jgi:hypothetical protein
MKSNARSATESVKTGSVDSVKSATSRFSGSSTGRPPPYDGASDHAPAPAHPTKVADGISRTLVNFWLDVLLATVFVVLCITAVIVQFVFPPGIASRGASLWGMSYGQWCGVQFSLLGILALGVLVHVMLHWTWVCGVLARQVLNKRHVPDNGIRTIYGVGLFICLLLIGATAIGLAEWMIIMPG